MAEEYFLYPPELSDVISKAFAQLHSQVRGTGPTLGVRIDEWMREASHTDHLEEAYKSPTSFPMLLLPWYAENTLAQEPDLDFQTELVYSTVNGYYYIRLIDNLMDGHSGNELNLLTALSFFHTQFQSPYQRYFEHDHPFWEYFRSTWYRSADVTLRDAGLSDIDLRSFIEVSAQKTCASKIPLAAVCYRYAHAEKIERWSRFVDLFGCWHQMWNDIFDWVKDTRNETQTYFLSEGNRKRERGEPLIDWVIREGFDWGISSLDGWMGEMQAMAPGLESPLLVAYLETRSRLFNEQKARAWEDLEAMGDLLSTIKRGLEIDNPHLGG